MGSRSSIAAKALVILLILFLLQTMKGMKAGVKPMSKTEIAAQLATELELKKSVCSKMIGSLAVIATQGVKSAGKFVIPNLCQIKLRQKPAMKAGKKMIFGKEVMVKAKPAKTIVKAFPTSALKKSI